MKKQILLEGNRSQRNNRIHPESMPPEQNLEQLQELYDEMIRYRSETKAKEGKL